MPEERPATYDEVISAIAKQYGVPPILALSVAENESNFDPKAVSKKGAIGIMQLMPGTAKELGVDPADPVANITGGVKYLKQLNDRYGGDVRKTLIAYNAGPGAVDSNKIPAESEAYVTSVMAALSRRARGNAASPPAPAPPAAGTPSLQTTTAAVPATTTPSPAAPKRSLLQQMGDMVDLRTRTGRQNTAGIVGATAGGILAGPTAAVSGPVGPATGALLGSMIGGGLEEGGEQLADWLFNKKAPNVGEVGKASATQGMYEAGGQILMWPLARFGRSLVATRVGKQASEYLSRTLESAKTTGRDLVRQASDAMGTQVAKAQDVSRDALQNTVEAGRSFIESTRGAGQRRVAQTTEAATQTLENVKADAAARQAKAELDAAATVADATKPYQGAANRPPSREALTATAREALGGLPGLHLEPTGPVKKALDLAGQQIEAAAKTGPMVASEPLKEALNKMAGKVEPSSLFGQQETRGIGFAKNLFSVTKSGQSAAAASMRPSAADQQKLIAAIAAQLGVAETHPLPGILAKIQEAPEQMSFADAHQLKRLLDEGVNWDRTAKKHLEALTKGIRTKLREVLSVHEPYNEATAAYQAIVPLYRKGAGAQAIKAAAERPDRLATLLKSANPADAQTVQKLLLDQSAAGGDAKVGQQAWDAVRATYTYDNVIAGGVKGLEGRITDLETAHPEFVKAVYGDATGNQVLNNLKRIGTAYRLAVEHGSASTAAAEETGKAAIGAAKTSGRADIQAATEAAQGSLRDARTTVADSIRARRTAGRQDVEAARETGKKALGTARDTAKAGVESAQAKVTKFKQSSMGPYAKRTLESEGADVLRGFGLGPKTIWGAMSLIRLLESPRSAELVQAAAHSDTLTQGVVRVLTGSETGTAAGVAIRELVSIVNGPPRKAAAPPQQTAAQGR